MKTTRNTFCKYFLNGSLLFDIPVGENTTHLQRLKKGIENQIQFDSYIYYYRDEKGVEISFEEKFNLGFKVVDKTIFKTNLITHKFEEKVSELPRLHEFEEYFEFKEICEKLDIPYKEEII